jgi:hypothetical protein
VTRDPWLTPGAEAMAVEWAIDHALGPHMREVEDRVVPRVRKVREEVHRRLKAEIERLDARHQDLMIRRSAGQDVGGNAAEITYRRARDLERRLEVRLRDLEAEEHLTVRPPMIDAVALVVSQGLVDRILRGAA